MAGYGSGGLWLTPDGGPALESGLSMAMAAAGTRGELVAGGAGGFALAFKADALWVGTSIDGVDGPAGRLKATEAAVTRVRTGLEGSRAYTLAGRLSLRPSVEVGLRHDGGDAETGAGMDVGVGLVVSDAATGLAVDVRVRMLVMHQADGFSERGVAVSLSYNPTPSTPLGLVARVAPSWGGQATSGAEALWGRETMAGMAHGGVASGNRLDGEVGYGLPVGSCFVDLKVSPTLLEAIRKGRPEPEGSGFVSTGVEESSALEDIGGPGASGMRLHVEALPAFAGGNPTITPQRDVEDRLPGDVSETTLVYATVKVLRAAVDGVDVACRQDAAAAAWHAEPIIRFLCSTFGDGIAGVRVTEDSFIVITAEFGRDNRIDVIIAVGSEGTCACRISTADTHIASTAPDVRWFEQVLKDRLAAVGVRGEAGKSNCR